MYLSRIALNVNDKHREIMRALAWPQLLHAAVEQSCPGGGQRNLWRIDWLGENCYLLLLSRARPDFTSIIEKLGYPQGRGEIKDYSPLLDRLQRGQVWRFRLRANPVRYSSSEKEKTSDRGKIFALSGVAQQKQWLAERAEKSGFLLAPDAFDIVHTEWKNFRKTPTGKHEVKLRTVTFEGVLTISDLEVFKNSLLSGIGRAKAYGCGLMTIARAGGDDGQ
ncbi:MAG: type I-E CRISPR-associated protein Cas6/Cse3/CasE [Desulfarculales bacterium]|jgi:CRISPR system Cascade subunit CasE|nr:type I-E CRISPR-associated protein Cas6/Cse3/CasE [Desulfarculales bacterium]